MIKIEKLSKEKLSECSDFIPDWNIIDNLYIKKEFSFKDFRSGLEFLNIVGDLSESLNHHPDVELTYQKLRIQISTHQIQSISELDIELARRIDNSYLKYRELKG